ncbi:hypothetical protein [Streptomyces sp. NBC_01363]|uniref:hypothetical protein n=1 Tax=Streptomyces sp. NBC_01363 TaxID=2903840 RepID=UPI00224EA521|nr:hypothetical protein [Streptomyces sp. NBC_01363]MCX4731042.1 hypothetical protein [Streptomyces sp. NBC_01363]
MNGTTRARLDAALAANDIWSALFALTADAPADLPAAIEARYGRAAKDERRHLSWLLGALGEPAVPVFLRLLGGSGDDGAVELLGTAVQRRLKLPAAELHRLAEELGATEPLVDAMGLSDAPDFAPFLGGLLDHKALRGRAALALGRLGAREWTVPIAQRLPGLTGLEYGAFVVALELLDDPAAIPHLLRELAEKRTSAGDVHHALVALTGQSPLLPLTPPDGEYGELVNRAWSERRLDHHYPPSIGPVTLDSPRHARFTVEDGRGRIRIDYDPPAPGSSWPRWGKSLRIDGERVYHVGSECGTCETTMSLLGWPPRAAREGADRLRTALADLDDLGSGALDAAAPLIEELPTGHYRVHLADLALERVTDPAASWWVRRRELREDDEPYTEDPLDDWPGTDHFQLRDRIPGETPTYGVLLPSQPLDVLDADTVARYTSAITAGHRPAALALAWVEDIYVEAEHPERFLVAAVLDGHHKLAACAAAGAPARVLLLSRAEDNWGPAAGWSAAFDEVLGQL